MSINLASDKIHVFPFGSTRDNDRLSRVLNEQNITQLVRNMTDIPSYVLRYSNNIIDFVIQGYYFSADISGIETRPLFAYISLSKLSNYAYLNGIDNSEDQPKFTGLTFVNDKKEILKDPNYDYYDLQLLNEAGEVPTNSKIRITSDSVETLSTISFDRIYCGNASFLTENLENS